MKRKSLGRLLVISILAAVGGCITLDEPLSDIMEAKADETLCGVWRHQSADGNINLGLVGLKPGDVGAPQGLLSISLPSFDKDKKTIESPEQMTAFVTQIKEASYLNVILNVSDPGKPETNLATVAGYKEWKARDTHPVNLVKYQVKGDQLILWLGDKDKDKDWQTDGEMRTKYGKSPKALAEFIEREGDAKLFPPDQKEVFVRVK
ncbi:MAG: hypothetical protein JWM57_801 [Phycisphaerales bacterium]|nr:hypothetical protein [Phycisphaerales bacterium]